MVKKGDVQGWQSSNLGDDVGRSQDAGDDQDLPGDPVDVDVSCAQDEAGQGGAIIFHFRINRHVCNEHYHNGTRA